MSTIAVQIRDKIVTALAGISVANGYNTNVQDSIKGNFISPESKKLQPYVHTALVERDYTGKYRPCNEAEPDIVFEIRGIVKDAVDYEPLADALSEDIEQVVSANYLWGGLAIETKVINTKFGVLDEEHGWGICLVEIVIQIEHEFGQPGG